MHLERLELKTLIDEPMARALRSEIAPFCAPDAHNAKLLGGGYSITSLYLDTPALAFHRAERRNDPFRLKLRVRTYAPEGPAHLEIKRRLLGVVDKTRVTVAREQWVRAASGLGRPLDGRPESLARLEAFAAEVARNAAEPALLVRYQREAWASDEDDLTRVTFDRQVVAQRVYGWDLEGDPTAWCPLSGPRWPVLLELKCSTTMPDWLAALVRRHHLSIQRFSKYARGITITESARGTAAALDAPASSAVALPRGR